MTTTDKPRLINIDGIENDINRESARRAYYNVSFHPERRGDQVIEGYTAELKALADHIESAAKDPRQQAIAQEVFDDLRDKYRQKVQAWLAAQSRCISAMIVGPAKFPVQRAEKANQSEHNRSTEMLAFSRSMKTYADRSLDRVFSTVEKMDATLASLTKQLADAEANQEFMKAANAALRKNGKYVGLQALFKARYGEANSEAMLQEFLKPNYMGRVGFESWQLSNNLANIKRLQGRVKDVAGKTERAQETPQTSEAREGLQIIRNHEADRLQLVFDGKPDDKIRDVLKRHGFKWSPRFNAWQRQLTANAEYALKHYILTNEALAQYATMAPDAAPEPQAPTPPAASIEPAETATPPQGLPAFTGKAVVFGREFDTWTFDSVADTNDFIAKHGDRLGVLSEDADGTIHVAHNDDKGREIVKRETPQGYVTQSHHAWREEVIAQHDAERPFAPENGEPLKYKIGDRVTYTNDQGVSFQNEVTGFYKPEKPDSLYATGYRYILDTDSPWMPVKEDNLKAPKAAIMTQKQEAPAASKRGQQGAFAF